MKLRPHRNDVVQVMGPTSYRGLPLRGQACIVDHVEGDVVSMHFTSNATEILANVADVDVLYRTDGS